MNEQELRLDIRRALDRRLETFRVNNPDATYRQISINWEVDNLVKNHTMDIMNKRKEMMAQDDMDFEEFKRLGKERDRIEERIRDIRREVEEEVGGAVQ